MTLMRIAAILAGGGVLAAAAADAPAGDATRGRALFMKNMCYTCHGTEGQGTRYGLKLAPNPLPWPAFSQQVRHPRSAMPRYPAEFVTDAELADIVAYLGSVKPSPKAADIPLLKE